jgi:predicted DNA-binding transcriptional regulator AlpA
MNDEYQLINEKEAAKLLALSPATLRIQRCTGATPNGLPKIPYIKIGRAVRYRRADIERYIDACAIAREPYKGKTS